MGVLGWDMRTTTKYCYPLPECAGGAQVLQLELISRQRFEKTVKSILQWTRKPFAGPIRPQEAGSHA
jgi:hypothetical protein